VPLALFIVVVVVGDNTSGKPGRRDDFFDTTIVRFRTLTEK
jgi:hypothetical protein